MDEHNNMMWKAVDQATTPIPDAAQKILGITIIEMG